MKKRPSSVPIAAPASLSPPGNKNSTRLKVLPMNLSAVPRAAEPTKHSVLIVAATVTRHGIKSSAYL